MLNETCEDSPGMACAGDINDDGSYDILDIVQLANCVLNETCDQL